MDETDHQDIATDEVEVKKLATKSTVNRDGD